jgi:hypothetical protein
MEVILFAMASPFRWFSHPFQCETESNRYRRFQLSVMAKECCLFRASVNRFALEKRVPARGTPTPAAFLGGIFAVR